MELEGGGVHCRFCKLIGFPTHYNVWQVAWLVNGQLYDPTQGKRYYG